MEFNNLFNLINNKGTESLIRNLSSGYLDLPYIMDNTLKLLDDNCAEDIMDKNKIAMSNMLSQYFETAYQIYNSSKSIVRASEKAEMLIYKIETANGIRQATIGEVDNGVRGLIGEKVYPAGENVYKYLNLLAWSYTGISAFFRRAGYQLEYTKEGKVVTSFYSMIQMCAYELLEMMKWCADEDNVNKDIARINKANKNFKLAQFEKDEITEDIPIKQIIKVVDEKCPRKNNVEKYNDRYKKAIGIILGGRKRGKNKPVYTPLEISYLREIYDDIARDSSLHNGLSGEEVEELKSTCEWILAQRYDGNIYSTDIVYDIIETLKKYGYRRCSVKQRNVIDNAIKRINKHKEAEVPDKKEEEIEEITSVTSLSEAIGNGLFED